MDINELRNSLITLSKTKKKSGPKVFRYWDIFKMKYANRIEVKWDEMDYHILFSSNRWIGYCFKKCV